MGKINVFEIQSRRPSNKMLNYVRMLIDKCQFNQEDYDLENWTYVDVTELIRELKSELGYK